MSDMQANAESSQREATILIIDDDPNNHAIMTAYLTERRYTILSADSGESGLIRAAYARPDLILLDIMMPGIDGFETCRRLKADARTSDIPVIFMTALAETEHKVKGFQAGAVDYITKPFQQHEALARVGVHLHIRELTTRLQEANLSLEKRVEERTTELAKANHLLRVLSECNQALVLATDETELLRDICRIIVEFGGYPQVWIGSVEDDRAQSVRPMAQVGFAEGQLDAAAITWADNERGQGPTGSAIRSGKPCIVRGTDFVGRETAPVARGHASSIALPLFAGDRVFGALTIYARELDAFAPQDVALLKEMAGDLAYGILSLRTREQRRQAEKEIHDRMRQASLGAEVGAALIRDDGLRPILQRCSEAIVRHLDAAFARIWTLNEKDDVLDLQASAGMYTHLNGPHGRITVGKYKIGLIAQEKKPHLTNAVIGDPRIGDQEWAKKEGMVAFAGYPLIVADRLVGVMAMFSRKALNESVLGALGAIADQIALGIVRKQTEESLRQSEALLRTLVQTIPDLIWLKDKDGVYLACNAMFERFFGAREVDIIGKTDYDFVDRELADFFREHDHKAMVAGKPTSNEEQVTFADDGHRVWLDTLKTPMVDAKGKLIGVLGIARDITERKRLEEQLRQSQKLESIGTLAGGIAHDFNNILAIILGYTELALDDVEDPKRCTEGLDRVKLATERAIALVKQILAISRRKAQEVQPLEVALVIKEALKMLRASIPTTIEIKQEITSDGIVLADSTQIHQVIMNLCTNAYHAMRETGGTLAVSLGDMEIRDEDEGYGELVPGRYLKLTVGDTGCGIAPEIQEKIFEPYFTTKQIGEGTGLGLAVVHGIIKNHHGHITVYSEPGRGTTFHVYLPQVAEQAAALPGEEPVADLGGQGERILFVDDEPVLREFAGWFFVKYGYQVTSLANGVEAWEEFQNHPGQFDLVITDMTMPQMTGAELARKILAIQPGMPIILCTGQSDLINREKALAMGVCAYLNKPVRKHDFLAAIGKALATKRKA